MGFIHYGETKTYNNGVLDDNIYSTVQESVDASSEYNPFDGGMIYYDEDEFEDQTTKTHNVVFNDSGSMTFDKLEVVEYTDTDCSNEKGRFFANKSIANNQTTFSWKFTDTDVNGFSLNIYVVSGSTKYTITYSIEDANWADKVVISPLSPIEVEKGSTTTVQVTPKTGYYFSGTDTCDMFIEEQLENVPFTLTSDGKMFLEMGESFSTETLTLKFTITKGEPPATNKRTNFYTVYAPTDENMKKINNTIFIDNNDVINKFISYKKFWCNIPTDGTAKLKAGNYDFNFEAPVVHGNIIDVGCGSISVEELHHSLLDYSPFSRLTIYLPFIGFMDLDDKLVMGKAVRVNYRVDVLSGRCLAEVYTMIDDSTESCIASYAGTIASDEPLSQGQVNYKGGYELMTSMQLGELTPFILVNTKVPLEGDIVNYKGLPTNEIVKVGDVSGFVKYSSIHVDGMTATDSEKSEIESLLMSGIFV